MNEIDDKATELRYSKIVQRNRASCLAIALPITPHNLQFSKVCLTLDFADTDESCLEAALQRTLGQHRCLVEAGAGK